MATVTKPMALDESFNSTENTPRNIADILAEELSNIANNVKPNADDISYSNTASGLSSNNVQDAIDEVVGDVDTKVSKSGDTMTGDLISRAHIKSDRQNGTTTQIGDSYVMIGNDTPSGTAKNSKGYLRLYSQGTKYINLATVSSVADNRTIYLPDKNGTIALEKGSVSREYTNKTWAEILADFWGSRIDKSRITPTSVLCASINNDDFLYTISATNAVRGIIPTYAYFIRSLVATGRNEAIYMDTTSSYNFYKKYVYNGNLDTDYTSTTVSSVTLTLFY